jgi:hypothetical protein
MTVTFIEVEGTGGLETHAVIENADGGFTSMLKSTYDAQQAAQVTLVTESAPTA